MRLQTFRQTLLIASLCAMAWGQTELTTIQDTLFNADGTLYNGSLFIQWSTFDTTNPGTVVQQSLTVPVVNGNLLVQLVPNANQPSPANVYTVQYQSDGLQQFTETWTVPASTVPLKVSQVRTGTITTGAGSGSGSGGSSGTPTPIPESDVINLQADLNQRPVRGPGYGIDRVAVVDDSGLIETAVGNVSDCVFVDGTSGTCMITFSDAETPGGTIDGSNATFTLAYTPLGSSLQLFLNGLYQTAGVDYTLTGSTIQFATGATPQPGDILIANYRVDTSSGGYVDVGNTSAQATTAQVLCSAAGSSNNTAAFTTLGSCTIPASALHTGDRIELRFTLQHTGTASTFEVQSLWGTVTMLDRTGATGDTAFAAQAEAAISASGVALSVQSWGTVLPSQTAIVTAALQPPVVVAIQARVIATGSDSVQLANYTVLRYPGN